mmetsp:Transcript_47075/g.54983  ORF Transcript_47075/g.54983 Transcript_47075/m.54983 type:complete len:104 (+) Transcript_47075:293-604(+)
MSIVTKRRSRHLACGHKRTNFRHTAVLYVAFNDYVSNLESVPGESLGTSSKSSKNKTSDQEEAETVLISTTERKATERGGFNRQEPSDKSSKQQQQDTCHSLS